LKARLNPICYRTLRRQVTAYIPYTKRLPLVEEFTPEDSEDRLYALVSEYLQRDNLRALPASQRSLMTLVLRKLLASSTFAIAGALASIAKRLKLELAAQTPAESLADELDRDYEALDETAEEWLDESSVDPLSAADRHAIADEIIELEAFATLAASINSNAKGTALLKALAVAFAKARELGADQKAIIFTESRRTQDYLLRLLTDSAFKDGIVLFNGSNTDARSKEIYTEWLQRQRGSDRVTGSRTADMRSALVDYFRDDGRIMIATEAGAEGINLQFCSLVVNYDLPWNPQRIEQRIGRCHRYGQKHDVVVVNFLNRKNAADQRVFELLSEKFHLFEGVFGASDEVLGAIESGVDFEKRIAAIYQGCRKQEEIKSAFDQLQLELSLEIDASMTRTRQKLLEHFDDEVREKLKMRKDASEEQLGRYERLLMQLTRHGLAGHAEFLGDAAFRLNTLPFPAGADIPRGLYELPRRSGEAHLYRLNHPLAEALVAQAKAHDLPPAEIHFDYGQHAGKVSSLQPLVGKSGQLAVWLLSVESLDQVEDHLIVAAVTDDGQVLDEGASRRLLTLPGRIMTSVVTVDETELRQIADNRKGFIQNDIAGRNARLFTAEAEKLDGWADDLKLGLERDIREFDRQIKEVRRSATMAVGLAEKLAAQKQIKALEAQRSQRRRTLFDAQDQIDNQRDMLIEGIEARLKQQTDSSRLITIRWSLIGSSQIKEGEAN
jgi:adenine-specific DNA-methyltransferase